MKINSLFIPLGSLMLLSLALALAILITPFNFLVMQVILLGGLFLFYLLCRDITNAVIIWLLCLLFVMFFKFSIGADMPNLSLDRVIWFLIMAYYLFHVITGKISLSHRLTEIFMFILFLLGAISIIKTRGLAFSRENLDTYSKLFNTYMVPFSIFLIAKDFINQEYKIRKLFIFLSIVLLYLSLTAVFEHFRLTAFVFPRDIMNANIGIHFGRARGPFLQAAINGTVLGMLSVTNLYMSTNVRWPYRIFFIAIAVISPIAVLFTYTRASWIAAALSLLFMLIVAHKIRRHIVFSILALLLIIVSMYSKIVDVDEVSLRSSDLSPVYDRVNLYHTYMVMFAERPFFGFGFDNFNSYSHEYFSRIRNNNPYNIRIPEIHDTFSGTLVELGVAGLLILIAIFVSIFRNSLVLFRSLKGQGFMGRGIVVTFWALGIVYLVNAFTVDMKYFQFQNAIFYMMAGIIAGLYQRKAHKERYA